MAHKKLMISADGLSDMESRKNQRYIGQHVKKPDDAAQSTHRYLIEVAQPIAELIALAYLAKERPGFRQGQLNIEIVEKERGNRKVRISLDDLSISGAIDIGPSAAGELLRQALPDCPAVAFLKFQKTAADLTDSGKNDYVHERTGVWRHRGFTLIADEMCEKVTLAAVSELKARKLQDQGRHAVDMPEASLASYAFSSRPRSKRITALTGKSRT